MYEVQFVGYVPEWNSVNVGNATTEDEVEELAINEIENLYPEMVDIEILEVKKI